MLRSEFTFVSGGIVGIDPGQRESGIIHYVSDGTRLFTDHGVLPNPEVLRFVCQHPNPESIVWAIEQIVGDHPYSGRQQVIDSVHWGGRFYQAAQMRGGTTLEITRKRVAKLVTGNGNANDRMIREALIGRFGQQGTKNSPGPLYGVKSHIWSALAVAVAAETEMQGLPDEGTEPESNLV